MTGSVKVPIGLSKSKTFCSLPWVNLSVDPDGKVKPCCVSTDFITDEYGKPYNLGYNDLSQIYNSDSFKEIRRQMLTGEKVKGCQKCYTEEEFAGTSSRLTYNRMFNVNNPKVTVDDINIKYFDLRFGNLCNLKCRTCNSTASNQIGKEMQEIGLEKIKDFGYLNLSDMNSWYKTEIFNTNLNSQLKNIRVVYLTGGEPTLSEENKNFLMRLANVNKNVTIKISSNLTNLNKDFYKLLSEFKKVIFFASIDGYKEIQEYLRYPSNWEQIDKNLQSLLTLKNVKLYATPVIQIGNLNKIVELFEYLSSFNSIARKMVIEIDPLYLKYPSYFDIINLPLDYKLMCWNKIETWLKNSKYQSENFKQKIMGIKEKCLIDQKGLTELRNFKIYNNILDQHRNHYLKDVNLELFEILNNI